ncbi:MopE-related protein [Nannocystis pusilla]|uniref:putative metal-binding motif-containing protein n=1 Tax=Nannocystis pusilla TaxID=889268 RepID=UPI003B7DC3D3
MGQPPKSWYPDGDGDGFGAEEPVTVACEAPPGAVDVAGDCDDTWFEVNPGADELCNRGVDDDCDGLVDEYSAVNLACGGCSLSELGGAVFWVCSEAVAFTAGEAFCQQFGAAVHLIHPLNATELAFVRDRIFDHLGEQPPDLGFWTGLHRREALWDECTTTPTPPTGSPSTAPPSTICRGATASRTTPSAPRCAPPSSSKTPSASARTASSSATAPPAPSTTAPAASTRSAWSARPAAIPEPTGPTRARSDDVFL